MSICPIDGGHCLCQPQEGTWCVNAKTESDHCKVWRFLVKEKVAPQDWIKDEEEVEAARACVKDLTFKYQAMHKAIRKYAIQKFIVSDDWHCKICTYTWRLTATKETHAQNCPASLEGVRIPEGEIGGENLA